ncbi:MAG: Coenzyme F420 hydrogenase/dehydrogenase, beta subunit C-terminal domain [Methanothrix sp.]|nr:Coenzyme F420 hydrogenase/dehydrogenase, beta subunit C-terminal domain [Methanothrix sp.]
MEKSALSQNLAHQNLMQIHLRRSEKDKIEPVLSPLEELKKTVWNKSACSGCRACISICPADALAYDLGRNHPYQVLPCVDCMACLDSCPRMPANNQNFIPSQVLGHYKVIQNARSKMKHKHFQNGGAVTGLLAAALEEELIDCALVMARDSWSQEPQPRVVYNAKDLDKCTGSKYTNNAILEPINDIAKGARSIALVGTPCSVQAVGLIRKSSNEFAAKIAQKVRFVVGLFCFEAYDNSLISEVSRLIGMPPWRFDKMNMSEGKMDIRLRDGSHRVIPLQDLAGHAKPGCKGCADFTAKLSDISAGSIGSAPGMTTIIVRTVEGLGLFNIAEEMGFLEVADGVNVEAIKKAGQLKLAKNGI